MYCIYCKLLHSYKYKYIVIRREYSIRYILYAVYPYYYHTGFFKKAATAKDVPRHRLHAPQLQCRRVRFDICGLQEKLPFRPVHVRGPISNIELGGYGGFRILFAPDLMAVFEEAGRFFPIMVYPWPTQPVTSPQRWMLRSTCFFLVSTSQPVTSPQRWMLRATSPRLFRSQSLLLAFLNLSIQLVTTPQRWMLRATSPRLLRSINCCRVWNLSSQPVTTPQR